MKYSRLSWAKLNKIFLCFAQDITATAAAKRSFCKNEVSVKNYWAKSGHN